MICSQSWFFWVLLFLWGQKKVEDLCGRSLLRTVWEWWPKWERQHCQMSYHVMCLWNSALEDHLGRSGVEQALRWIWLMIKAHTIVALPGLGIGSSFCCKRSMPSEIGSLHQKSKSRGTSLWVIKRQASWQQWVIEISVLESRMVFEDHQHINSYALLIKTFSVNKKRI